MIKLLKLKQLFTRSAPPADSTLAPDTESAPEVEPEVARRRPDEPKVSFSHSAMMLAVHGALSDAQVRRDSYKAKAINVEPEFNSYAVILEVTAEFDPRADGQSMDCAQVESAMRARAQQFKLGLDRIFWQIDPLSHLMESSQPRPELAQVQAQAPQEVPDGVELDLDFTQEAAAASSAGDAPAQESPAPSAPKHIEP